MPNDDKQITNIKELFNTGIEQIKTDIEEIKDDIKDTNQEIKALKTNLYEPDEGIYARLVKIDTKTNDHQKWLDIIGKIFWILFGSGITVAAKFLFGL